MRTRNRRSAVGILTDHVEELATGGSWESSILALDLAHVRSTRPQRLWSHKFGGMRVQPKLRCAILGSGNIGTDLMFKVLKSPELELALMAGIDPNSDGLKRARAQGVKTSHEGIRAVLDDASIQLVWDATSASVHIRHHAKALRDANVVCVDLTPAALGPYVVPALDRNDWFSELNVNLISCGGQATVPIVAAVNQVSPVKYAEVVSTISSKSAGPGTRQNIDEFTRTTRAGLEAVSGAERGKALVILNPADPPILMRNTIYCEVSPDADEETISRAVEEMVQTIQGYVPGYRLRVPPFKDGNRIVTTIEVEGAGDYLPKYSGNLDIMTAAAVAVAEKLSSHYATESTHV